VRLLSFEEDEDDVASAREEVATEVGRLGEAASNGETRIVERVVEKIVHRPMRRRLPDTRQSMTHKFNVAGHEGYLTVGLYEDNTPGELFITMSKEGSTIGGLMDSLGTATSVALQYGVPIESLVRKFTHQRFEPAGITANKEIPIAKSLVDYIFRWLGIQFVEGYREQVVPKRVLDNDASSPARPGDDSPARHRVDRIVRLDTGDAGKGRARTGAAAETKAHAPAPGGAGAKPQRDALSTALAEFQEDAPPCEVCGTITVRNGTCYRCMNCGNSMGCS
jgi:ribonucleoside-diphosphate reductase alpha chain